MTQKIYIPTKEEKILVDQCISNAIDALSPLKKIELKAFALIIMVQEFEKITNVKINESAVH